MCGISTRPECAMPDPLCPNSTQRRKWRARGTIDQGEKREENERHFAYLKQEATVVVFTSGYNADENKRCVFVKRPDDVSDIFVLVRNDFHLPRRYCWEQKREKKINSGTRELKFSNKLQGFALLKHICTRCFKRNLTRS